MSLVLLRQLIDYLELIAEKQVVVYMTGLMMAKLPVTEQLAFW